MRSWLTLNKPNYRHFTFNSEDRVIMDKPRDVVERWYRSLSSRDFDTYAATLHDEVIINVAGRTPVSGKWVGKKELFETVLPLVMENLVEETVNLARRFRIVAEDGPIVVGMMEGGAVNKQGERYEQSYCQIFRVEHGLIVESWEFFDTLQAEARLFGKPFDCGTPPERPFTF